MLLCCLAELFFFLLRHSLVAVPCSALWLCRAHQFLGYVLVHHRALTYSAQCCVSHTALVLSRSCTNHVRFSSCGSQRGFVEKLVQRIVDNIEINVADIHIRCGDCLLFRYFFLPPVESAADHSWLVSSCRVSRR